MSSISLKRDYVTEPLALFRALKGTHQVLLESAEIDSKDALKSLLLSDAALKVVAKDQKVSLIPLTPNGQTVLNYLKGRFEQLDSVSVTETNKVVTVAISPSTELLDEAQKLKATTVFSVLRTLLADIEATSTQAYSVFLAGTFAYDLLASTESLPDVPDGDNDCPDYVFYLAETLVVVDHQAQTTELIANVFSGDDAYSNCFDVGQKLEQLNALCDEVAESPTVPAPTFTAAKDVAVNVSDAAFCEQVSALKAHILAGDIFQVVPSRTFSMPVTDPLSAYGALKAQNPSPYMFYVKDSDFAIFGASPESALTYDASSNCVSVYPIAGTRPRAKNPDGSINLDKDVKIELSLQNDEKERAEHIMLVDLARNDIARISVAGSRYVKEFLKVDRYSQVMHLVSKVVGELKPELDALHAYAASMNMGTLVGAPKIKAASLIRETEKVRRGSYGGAVGYMTGRGDMDTCITIRSAFVKNNIAYVSAGAGVVYDSIPQAEADETRAKAQAVLNAIASSEAQQ